MWDEFSQKLKSLTSSWTTITAIGSLPIYFIGYLAVRFRLTVFGVGSDLEVLDERYLFEGLKFLVFLITTVPIALLVALAVLIVLSPFYLMVRQTIQTKPAARLAAWWSRQVNNPKRVAVFGITLSLLFIQLVMRQCLYFNNLLMREELPEPKWLHSVLLTKGDGIEALFFPSLILGVAVSTSIFCHFFRIAKEDVYGNRFYTSLFGILVVVQFLLLPLNYGILSGTNFSAKVAPPAGLSETDGASAWLIWEGKNGMTYFRYDKDNPENERALVTLAKGSIPKTEILSYDHLLSDLFAAKTETVSDGEKPLTDK